MIHKTQQWPGPGLSTAILVLCFCLVTRFWPLWPLPFSRAHSQPQTLKPAIPRLRNFFARISLWLVYPHLSTFSTNVISFENLSWPLFLNRCLVSSYSLSATLFIPLVELIKLYNNPICLFTGWSTMSSLERDP